MNPPPILTRSQETGLSDTTHSSCGSAEKYDLDEEDSSPILLYQYRGTLKTSTQKDLCACLEKDEFLRVTKKTIPRFTSYISVKRHDLYLPEEKSQYAEYPNYDSNLASIKVPSIAYWSRAFFGSYQELYIVSPETSPASSQADEDSRRTSPTNTWNGDVEDEARSGGAQNVSH